MKSQRTVCAEASGAGIFAPDDVVPLDYSGDSDGFLICGRAFVDANNASVSADEDFGAARDLSGQRERKIDLGARCEIFFYDKVNAACGNIPRLAAVGPRLPVDWQADVHRQR